MNADSNSDQAAENPDWEPMKADAPIYELHTFVATSIRRIMDGGIEAAILDRQVTEALEDDARDQAARAATWQPAQAADTEADTWDLLPPGIPDSRPLPATVTHTDQPPPRPLTRQSQRARESRVAGGDQISDGHGDQVTDTDTVTGHQHDQDSNISQAAPGKGNGGSPESIRLEAARLARDIATRWRPQYLAALALCPNERLACQAAAVSRTTVRRLRQQDASFELEEQEAIRDGVDLLHAVAWQRATEGTVRPIYQGGIRVGQEVVYSDKLMMELLKAHKPEQFRPAAGGKVSISIGPGGQTTVSTPSEVLQTVREITPLIRNRAAEAPIRLMSRTTDS